MRELLITRLFRIIINIALNFMEISDADDDGLFLLLFVCCFSCWRCHLINPATPDVITILEMAIHDIYTAPTLSPRDTPRLVAHARRIIHPGLVHLRDFICEKGWTHFECRIVPRSASSKLRLLFLLIWRTYYFYNWVLNLSWDT